MFVLQEVLSSMNLVSRREVCLPTAEDGLSEGTFCYDSYISYYLMMLQLKGCIHNAQRIMEYKTRLQHKIFQLTYRFFMSLHISLFQ